MDSRNDYGYGRSSTMDDVSLEDGTSSFGWNMFLVAVAVAMIAVNWGFLRPASRQLEEMRAHIGTLEKTVARLSEQHTAAARSADLLALLTEQGERNEQAADSLNRIGRLHDQLIRETARLQEATQFVEQLAELRQEVLRQSQLVNQTRRALNETNELQQRLLASARANKEAETALNRLSSVQRRVADSSRLLLETEALVDDVDGLHRHLLSTAQLHNQALDVVDQVADISETLVGQADSVVDARWTLDDLIAIRTQLSAQTPHMPQSQQTFEQMVQLKDDVLAQTETIGDAIVTLEQTADLAAQFHEANASFEEVRRWLTEVVMMQPMLQRAMQTLEPITALGNLRRVSADELRQAARVIREIRDTELARAKTDTPPAKVALKPGG